MMNAKRNISLSRVLFIVLSLVWGFELLAKETLVIISPHRKSIQSETVPLFEAYYKKKFKKEVKVEWLDQGGTSDDLRFVNAKFAANPKTSGIDIFWGGGNTAFDDLKNSGLLQAYELPKELRKLVPAKLAGIEISDPKNYWHGTAVSTFGIFYNNFLLKRLKLEVPKTWTDLTKPKYFGHISVTDPRRSGSASTMNFIILDSLGWDKGWQTLHELAGNTKRFTHSSSDPIKDVMSGAARIAMAIDFYALAKVADLGPQKVNFSIPEDHSVFNPDPIAILKGAPNQKIAQEFVKFALSVDAQKVLMLKTTEKDGPKRSNLGRLAVNRQAYEQTEGRRIQNFNPFTKGVRVRGLDTSKSQKQMKVLNDIIGTMMVDLHTDMTGAWKAVQKRGAKPTEVQAFSKLPFTQAQLNSYANKWSDNVFRNKKLNEWTKIAKNKYNMIAQNKLSSLKK